jgi:hypothetical protein
MYTDAADVVAADLALAGVQPGAYLDAERLYGVADRHRAADRSLRAAGADVAATINSTYNQITVG